MRMTADTGNARNKTDQMALFSLFWTFFRIGLLTLGGGFAMSIVLRHELVHVRRWISDQDFMRELSTATLVPGAIAVNMAYLQGRQMRGMSGAAAAVLGTILPSFLIILGVAWFAYPYFSHPTVAAFFRGCAIAVTGQLAFTGFVFGRKLLRTWRRVLVCVLGLVVVAGMGVHPIFAVIVTGSVGYWMCPISASPQDGQHSE